MPPANATIEPTAHPASRKQRAKTLFARLRHRQLLSAKSGRVTESAVYARRALRVKRSVCPCAA